MKNKHQRNNIFLKLTMLCYTAFTLIILNSCVPTLANVDDEQPSEGIGNAIYKKLVNESIAGVDIVKLEEPDIFEETKVDEDEPKILEEEEWPERVAFLTFDDGPSTQTLEILDVLYEENVPAIFFLVGETILYNLPDSQVWIERILEEGHYIGLHTMSHEYYTLYVGDDAPSRFVDEMFELQGLIYDLTEHHTYLCRAAYGMMTGFRPGHFVAVDDAGIKCIDWNIDPKDWRNNAQHIYEYVVQQVEMLNFPSELVIVFHEYDQTVEALPAVIAFLREQGYVFKTYEPGYEFTYHEYQ